MNHALLMEIVHGCANLLEQQQPWPRTKFMFRTKLVDGRPIDEIHHKIWQASPSRSAIDDAGNIDVVQSGQYLALLAETLYQRIRGYFRANDLYGADSLKNLICTHRLIHDAHPTAAQFLKNL